MTTDLRQADRHIALALALLGILGCGPPRGSVAGKVTLDGQPIDGGTILFISLKGSQRESGWAEIMGGEYSISASRGPTVGPCRVEVRWPRKTGRKLPQDPDLDEWREVVPNRYHLDSELLVDVKPGKNCLDYSLRSP